MAYRFVFEIGFCVMMRRNAVYRSRATLYVDDE
jgi:hypothetical protein